MKLVMTVILIMISFASNAQESADKNIKYEYKKFEKFDLEEIGVEGNSGAPGDLSVIPSPQKTYDNRLPQKPNFHSEMKRGALRVQ